MEDSTSVAIVGGIGAVIGIGVALFAKPIAGWLAATLTPVKPVVAKRHGSEEESGVGSGMSSMIGPGSTPPGWRDGANIF